MTMMNDNELEEMKADYKESISDFSDEELMSSHYQTKLIQNEIDETGSCPEGSGIPYATFAELSQMEVDELNKRGLMAKYEEKYK